MTVKPFIKEEASGIKDYERAAAHSKGRERKVYKKIIPEEKKHLRELKQVMAKKLKK